MSTIKKSNLFLLYFLLYTFLIECFIQILQYMKIDITNNLKLIQLLSVALPVFLYPIITRMDFRDFCYKRINIKTTILILILSVISIPISGMIIEITTILIPSAMDASPVYELSNINLFDTIIIVVLIPSIFEEMAIRGIVMSGYMKNKLLPSVIFSGILFGLFHANLYQFFYTSGIGIILALLLRYGGSIFYCMIFHGVYNFAPTLIGYFYNNNSNEQQSQSIMTKIQMIQLVVLFIISLMLVLFILKTIKTINKGKYEAFILEVEERNRIKKLKYNKKYDVVSENNELKMDILNKDYNKDSFYVSKETISYKIDSNLYLHNDLNIEDHKDKKRKKEDKHRIVTISYIITFIVYMSLMILLQISVK